MFFLSSCISDVTLSYSLFLMIRRPPISTPLSLHDALPIYSEKLCSVFPPRVFNVLHKPSSLMPHTEEERPMWPRSEEHTSELQSRGHLVCRLLLEKKNKKNYKGRTNARNYGPRT